jgi:tRNA (cmo5U34)-methyltransferase
MDRRNGFDSVACYYDQLARLVFGSAISDSQSDHFAYVPNPSQVLALGGGTGWWLKDLLRIKPDCQILFVEPSYRMIEMARKSIGPDKRVCFMQGTAESISEDKRFDAVLFFCF